MMKETFGDDLEFACYGHETGEDGDARGGLWEHALRSYEIVVDGLGE